MHIRARGEAGQALPLMIAVVALALVALVVVGRLAGATVDAARARTAADAAALAGVGGGRAAAAQLVADSGGRLLHFVVEGEAVEVVVVVGRATARARAEPGPSP